MRANRASIHTLAGLVNVACADKFVVVVHRPEYEGNCSSFQGPYLIPVFKFRRAEAKRVIRTEYPTAHAVLAHVCDEVVQLIFVKVPRRW